MKSLVSAICCSFLLLAAAAAANKQRCGASARECDIQIRTMIAGKKFLGIKLIESRWGPVVESIVPRSNAALAGLAPGDRILAVNSRNCCANVAEFKRTLSRLPTGRISISVVRDGQIRIFHPQLIPITREQIAKVVEAHLRDAHDQR